MISKTSAHISGQNPQGRQPKAKVCCCKSAIWVFFFSCYNHYIQQRYLENSLSTHHHFSTKLMLITVQSSKTTQRLYSFKFTLVNKAVYSTAQLLSVSLGALSCSFCPKWWGFECLRSENNAWVKCILSIGDPFPLCLPRYTKHHLHDKNGPGLPLHFHILQAIKNWTIGRPENEATHSICTPYLRCLNDCQVIHSAESGTHLCT